MKKTLIAIATAALLSPAFAGNDVPGNCGNGSGSGNACLPGSSNTVTNTNSSKNSNVNANVNSNKSHSSSKSNSTSSARNNSVNLNLNASRTDNSSNNSSKNSATSSGNTTSNDTSLVQHYEESRNPVNTAYAAPLTATNGTCMGSTSAGGQGVGFGVSFGTTWQDDNCDRRYDANTLTALGQTEAALALMCQKSSIAEAMKAAGKTCPNTDVKDGKVANVASESSHVDQTDPYIRARLGLAPLSK